MYYYAWPGTPWSRTQIAGSGTTFSAPSIAVRSSGEADIIAEGPNNGLMYYTAAASFSLQQGAVYETSQGVTTQIASNVPTLAVESINGTNRAFELTSAGQVKEYVPGSGWLAVTGANTHATELVAAGNELYMEASNNIGDPSSYQVWQYSGQGTNWTPITSTSVFDISDIAAAGGHLFMRGINAVANGGRSGLAQVWEYSGQGTNWAAVTGTNTSVFDIVAAGNQLYMLGTNGNYYGPYQVWQYSGQGTNWTPVTGDNTSVSQIAAASGHLYMLGNNGGTNQVWQYSGQGTNWTPVTGANTSVSDIEKAGNQLYMLGNNGGPNRVWEYSGQGTNWTPVTGTNTNVKELAANGDGLYMVAANNGGPNQVWQDAGSPGAWFALTSTNTQVLNIDTANGEGLYMDDGEYLWMYDGVPYQWTEVGLVLH
jgi:hypothetical protein